MLKLMYITNRPELAGIAEQAGTDCIFVDLEWLGKADRQGGMDTVQSHHTIEDVRRVRAAVRRAQLLVRVNPLHEAGADYPDSKTEIDQAVQAGAELLMLPYFHTAAEAERFVELVDGRAGTVLLLETAQAAAQVEQLARLPGVDEIFIGLNDLSLSMGRRFLFDLLADGTVERLCHRLAEAGMPFGFGGIAAPGQGAVPAEGIIREHYRLGSGRVILSRSFYRPKEPFDPAEAEEAFRTGIAAIRRTEAECQVHSGFFTENRRSLKAAIRKVSGAL